MTDHDAERCSVEHVDVLAPPDFEPTGIVKPVSEALAAEDWLGVINLWLVRPNSYLLYQQRPDHGWEPGKLDSSVGGFYRAGEFGLDGIREAREELGKDFSPDKISFLGRHLSVGVDGEGRERRLMVSVFMTTCSIPLEEFVLDQREVPGLYEIKADDVIAAFHSPDFNFFANGIDPAGELIKRQVCAGDFSYIFGGYHAKIANIAKEYANGKRQFNY